jgi:hypothetical protein
LPILKLGDSQHVLKHLDQQMYRAFNAIKVLGLSL